MRRGAPRPQPGDMTETTFTSPRLERPTHAPLAGVSLALARTTGTSHVLWRVLFVVLTVFGGLGIALYLVCWAGIPTEGQEHSLLSRLLHGPDRRVTGRQVVLLAAVVLAIGAAMHDNGGAVVVLGLGALGYLWWRSRHGGDDLTAAVVSAPPLPEAPGATPADGGAESVAVDRPAWQPPVAPARPRSLLTGLTLSLASLVVGGLLLVGATDAHSVPAEVVLAAALGVVGLGLTLSAVWGRARGLVPVAVLLALALAGTVGVRPALDHGVGERHWVVTGASATRFQLGIGDATLVLPAGTETAGRGTVRARVGLGHLEIVVPEGLAVVVDAHVQNGDIQGAGFDANGRDVDHRFVFGSRTADALHIDASVGAGQVEVRRA